MILYVSHRAPNPRRLMFTLAEKGLVDPQTGAATPAAGDLEVRQVDIFTGAHQTPEFKAISPLSQLPALQLDDGRALTESRAIALYFEGLRPEPNLYGRDSEERAFIEMWDRRMELLLFVPAAWAVRHGHPAFTGIENQNPDLAARGGARLEAITGWLDAQLADRAFIAGSRFTAADITAVAGLDFAKLAKFRTPPETWPNLARWRDAVTARPAAKAGV